MSTETEKPTPESTGDPKARTRAEVKAKREQKREERRTARADKAADKEARAAEKASDKAAKAEGRAEKGKGGSDTSGSGKAKKGLPSLGGGVDSVRTLLGQVIWIVAVVCALFLAVGALCIALDANRGNELVSFVLSGADAVSLGIFSLEDGIKTFVGVNSDVKNALVNYGIGAVAYLVVGRVLERVIRP